jgi:hypothetical protein
MWYRFEFIFLSYIFEIIFKIEILNDIKIKNAI